MGEGGIRSSGGAEEGSYLIRLTDVTNSFVPTATGACQSRTDDDRHDVHDDAAVVLLLLERPGEPKWHPWALRHAALAHEQRVSAGAAVHWPHISRRGQQRRSAPGCEDRQR